MCEHWLELFRHVVFAYSGPGMITWFLKHCAVEYYLKEVSKRSLSSRINTVLVGTDKTNHEMSATDTINCSAKNTILSCLKKKSYIKLT